MNLKLTIISFGKAPKPILRQLDSKASTSVGCSKCYKVDVQACVTNLAKLEKLIKAKDAQLKRLNKLVINGYEGDTKSEPEDINKEGRCSHKKDGLGVTP
jgi:hypothetical protein